MYPYGGLGWVSFFVCWGVGGGGQGWPFVGGSIFHPKFDHGSQIAPNYLGSICSNLSYLYRLFPSSSFMASTCHAFFYNFILFGVSISYQGINISDAKQKKKDFVEG